MQRFTINQRINASFGLMVLLILILAAVGLYSVQTQKSTEDQLTFITGPAWQTADGAMEATIFIEAEMLAIERLLSRGQNQEVLANQAELRAAAEEAIEATKSGQLLPRQAIAELESLLATYRSAADKVVQRFQEQSRALDSLEATAKQFVELSTAVEEIGDQAFESLAKDPSLTTSWESGLAERWAVADGAMEAFIGFLQVEQLTALYLSGERFEEIEPRLQEAFSFQNQAAEEMLATGHFSIPNPANPTQTLAEAYSALSGEHRKKTLATLEATRLLRDQKAIYQQHASSLLEAMEAFEETGDQAVEGVEIKINHNRALILTVASISLLVGIVCSVTISRSIRLPIRKMAGHLTESAHAESGAAPKCSPPVAASPTIPPPKHLFSKRSDLLSR